MSARRVPHAIHPPVLALGVVHRLEHRREGALDRARGVGKKRQTPVEVLLSLGVEDVEDRAHEEVVCGQIPVVPTALPVRVDEHVGDELRVPDVVRPRAYLQQRVVAGRGAVSSGGVELEAHAPEAVASPAGGQGPVLAFDVVHNHARRPAQERREHQPNAFPRARRGEREDMLGTVVTEIESLLLLGPGTHVHAVCAADEASGGQIGARRPAGGAVSVRRAHKPPSPPHRDYDRDEHGRVTRDRHQPRALAPDLCGAWSVAEAPPPDEEVEGRVERADAQCQERPRENEEHHRSAPPGRYHQTADPEGSDQNGSGTEQLAVRRSSGDQRSPERRVEVEAVGRELGSRPDAEEYDSRDRPDSAEVDPGRRVAPCNGKSVECRPAHRVWPRSRSRSSSPSRQTRTLRFRSSSCS